MEIPVPMKRQQDRARYALRRTFTTDSLEPIFDYVSFVHYLCASSSPEESVFARMYIEACVDVRKRGFDLNDETSESTLLYFGKYRKGSTNSSVSFSAVSKRSRKKRCAVADRSDGMSCD